MKYPLTQLFLLGVIIRESWALTLEQQHRTFPASPQGKNGEIAMRLASAQKVSVNISRTSLASNVSADSGQNRSATRIFLQEIIFGAPWGVGPLEQELRCNDHVRGTLTGKVEFGASEVEAVRVLYFQPYGVDPTIRLLEAYAAHCKRTDLFTCVSMGCREAIFTTTKEQLDATKAMKGTDQFALQHDAVVECAGLTTWSTFGISKQGELHPACDTDDWASNMRFNSTLEGDLIPLSDRC